MQTGGKTLHQFRKRNLFAGQRARPALRVRRTGAHRSPLFFPPDLSGFIVGFFVPPDRTAWLDSPVWRSNRWGAL